MRVALSDSIGRLIDSAGRCSALCYIALSGLRYIERKVLSLALKGHKNSAMGIAHRIGISSYRNIVVSEYRRIGISSYRNIVVSEYRRIGISSYRPYDTAIGFATLFISAQDKFADSIMRCPILLYYRPYSAVFALNGQHI
jgi:hypothetical protein